MTPISKLHRCSELAFSNRTGLLLVMKNTTELERHNEQEPYDNQNSQSALFIC